MATCLSSFKPAFSAVQLPSTRRAKQTSMARGVVSAGAVAPDCDGTVTEPVTVSDIIDVEFVGQEDDGRYRSAFADVRQHRSRVLSASSRDLLVYARVENRQNSA